MTTSRLTADEALQQLRVGNERFVSGTRSVEALVTQLRRHEFVDVQAPFAVVLTCSDSRVPVELVFDQGVGDLFVIRVAGNIVAPSLVGSVEYAVALLGTQLVVVMGHTRCGAVTATLDTMRGRGNVPTDNIRSIVDRIRPSAEELLRAGHSLDDQTLLAHAIRANVRASVSHLRYGSRLLEDLSLEGKLAIVGAEYDLATGVVDFFDMPTESQATADAVAEARTAAVHALGRAE